MFNFTGLFAMLFAFSSLVWGAVGALLKVMGFLLLPWGWVVAPFVVALVLVALVAAAR